MRFHFHGRRHGCGDGPPVFQFGSRDWEFPWGNIHFEHGGGPAEGGPRGGGSWVRRSLRQAEPSRLPTWTRRPTHFGQRTKHSPPDLRPHSPA